MNKLGLDEDQTDQLVEALFEQNAKIKESVVLTHEEICAILAIIELFAGRINEQMKAGDVHGDDFDGHCELVRVALGATGSLGDAIKSGLTRMMGGAIAPR